MIAEAENLADDYLSETVAAIVGHFALQAVAEADPATRAQADPAARAQADQAARIQAAEARESILIPVWEQNEALRQQRRRRRVPLDVDPESGAELPNENQPDSSDVPASEIPDQGQGEPLSQSDNESGSESSNDNQTAPAAAGSAEPAA